MKTIFRKSLTVMALGAVAVATAGAQLAIARSYTLARESRIWFEGTSTVRSFKCSAPKVDAVIAGEANAAPSELVQAASLSIPVAQLDCGNGTMNEHMRKALKANENPQIAWKMTSYSVEGANVAIDGRLTIAGKENAVEIRGTGSTENGALKFKGSKQIRMTEYGVKPPSLMLGTMKVGDAITVSFDLLLYQ
jgi:polyisoprenoid-binding protein YceI